MAKVRVNWGASEVEEQVSVFGVYNTAHKCLYVLARDSNEAMSIACTANHIYGTTPIIADDYGRHAFQVKQLPKILLPFEAAIAVAVSMRLRGTLHIDRQRLALGSEVISE